MSQGIETQDFHPAGQGIGQPRHQQDIGGTGQQEAPRRAPGIHGGLQRGEELRNPLDLVQHRPLGQIGDITHRIGPRRRQLQVVVKSEVGEPGLVPDQPGQGGLPALPGTVDQDHRRIGERLKDARTQEPGIEFRSFHSDRL